MKKLLFILFLFTSVAVNAQTKADRQAILDVMESTRKAWNTGNLEEFMKGYWKSDSLLFVTADGPTYGYQQTLDKYRKTYKESKAGMGQLTYGIKKVEFISADAAFVMGSWHLKMDKDKLDGYFTLIYRKIKGKWLMVADHSS